MMDLLLIAAVALVVVMVLVPLSRANELFFVSIRDGRCLIVRGHVPPSLYSELCAVVRISGAKRGFVRAVKEEGRPRLVIGGLDEFTAQRVRNALGARGFSRVGAASLQSSGQSSGGRNLGQILGIAWLAWLFTNRS